MFKIRPYRALVVLALIVPIGGSAQVRLWAQGKDVGEGAQQFVEYCAGCHGADGRGGDKAPSLVSASGQATHSDAELFQIIHDGTMGGMPPFAQIGDANIAALVQFLRALEGQSGSTSTEGPITGNADAGRTLFFGKAQCSTCHLMQGKGGFIAVSLTNYGRHRPPDAIRHAIINPDDPLVPSSRVVNVTTAAGDKLSGVLRNEDNFTMALQTEDGRYHFFARSDLKDVQHTDHSLMPHDYATRLTAEELDDIVSFMIVTSRAAGTEAAHRQ